MDGIKDKLAIVKYLNSKIDNELNKNDLSDYLNDVKDTIRDEDQTELEWIIENRNNYKIETQDAHDTLVKIYEYNSEMDKLLEELKELIDEQGD